MDNGWKITQVRIPADLYAMVKEWARCARKSLNQAIVDALNEKMSANNEGQ